MKTMAERLKSRLSAMNLTVTEATNLGGFKRTFVQDLVSGKKQTVQSKSLVKLAAVLNCTPAYLTGVSDEVGGITAIEGQVPLAGICEIGVWRDTSVTSYLPSHVTANIFDYPAAAGIAFLIHGHGGEDANIPSQSLVIGIKPEYARGGTGEIQVGDIVVLKRQRVGTNEAETSVRRVELRDGRKVLAVPSKALQEAPVIPLPSSDAAGAGGEIHSIEALVLRCVILLTPDERHAVFGHP